MLRSKRLGAIAAYLVLAVASGYSVQQVNHQSAERRVETRVQQIKACERTNDLRTQVNTEFEAVVEANGINYRLLSEVAKSGGSGVSAQIGEAAQAYQKLRDRYKPLAIIDCEQVYKA